MVWFIDKLGRKYSNEKISSHIGLALLIMDENPKLKEEYESNNERDPSLFLLKKKEWMMGSDIKRQIIFNRSTLTDKQRQWLRYYVLEERYKKDDRFDVSEEVEDEIEKEKTADVSQGDQR